MSFFDLDGSLPKGRVTPEAELDFSVDVTDWLVNDAIDTVVWSMSPAGLTNFSQTVNGGLLTVWLKGFVLGKTYEITCKFTTDSTPPRIDTRRFLLTCGKK